jgi:hypothetical protein
MQPPPPRRIETFHNNKFFYGEGVLAQPASWRTTLFRLSATAYSIYSQLASVTGGLPSIHNLGTRHAVVTRDPLNMSGHVARMGEGRGVYMILVGKPEGKRPLGRPRCRWEDNITLDLREIGIDGANWIQLAHDRIQWRACVNTAMNLRVP